MSRKLELVREFYKVSRFNGTAYCRNAGSRASRWLVVHALAVSALLWSGPTQAAIMTAFWKGGFTGGNNVWSATNGSTQSNWVATLGGVNQPFVPDSGTDVVFSNSTVTTSPNNTTLGANMAIHSLTINDTNNTLNLNADSYTLTIGSGGISLITGPQNSTETINANLILSAAQTWTNNSPYVSGSPNAGNNILAVNGNVNNNGNLLTCLLYTSPSPRD